jgi:hypothetical protein
MSIPEGLPSAQTLILLRMKVSTPEEAPRQKEVPSKQTNAPLSREIAPLSLEYLAPSAYPGKSHGDTLEDQRAIVASDSHPTSDKRAA